MEWARNIPFTVLRKEYTLKYMISAYGRQKIQEFVRRTAPMSDEGLARMGASVAASATREGRKIDLDEAMVESLALHDRIHTFVFSPDLCAALRQTDPGKFERDALRLPFHWVYIDVGLDPIMVPKAIGGIEIPNRNIEARGVVLADVWPSKGLVGFVVMYSPEQIDPATGSGAPWNLIPIRLDEMVEMDGEVFDPAGLVSEDDARSFGQEVMRLVVNAIMYINCVNADVREEKLKNPNLPDQRGRVLARDVAGKPGEGGTVRRCGFYIRLPQVGVGGGEGTGGWKVGVRFLVRGHWHRFWTGPMDGERKLVTRWVEPFWKGPDAAEVMHQKIYKVEVKP